MRTERSHQAAGPHVKVSARPPSARRAHRAFSPSYAPVPLGRRRRGGACAVIRLLMTRGVTGSAAIDAAALFARRCPSRRAMACGKSSGRSDASLSHLATGRPPRCALLPIGDSAALVPHPVSPLPPQPSLYCRRAGGWPARRLRSAIAWMRRRACRSRGRSPTVCATAVACLPPGGRTQWAARGGGAAARWRKPPRASEFLERCVRRPALEVAMTACSHLTCGHAWAGISSLPRRLGVGRSEPGSTVRLTCGIPCKAGMECFIRKYMITKFD